MQDSNLLRLLSSLSQLEMKKFGYYIHSPFFNNLSHVTKLYDVLKKYYPYFNQKHFTKEFVYSRLYPGEKYNDVRLRRLMSILLKHSEDFLAYLIFKSENFDYQKYLLRTLRGKKLDALFRKNYKKTLSMLEKQCKSEDYFLNKYFLECEYFLFNQDKYHYDQSSKLSEKFYNDCNTHINNSYFIRLLKNHCEALNYKECININLDFSPHDFLLNALTNYPHSEVVYINLYHKILLLKLGINREENVNEIYKILLEHEQDIESFDQYNIFMQIRNFYTDLIFLEDKKEYYKNAHELDKELIKRNLVFYENLYFLPAHYISIFNYALALNELQWAENFILKYEKKLDSKIRKDVFSFCCASLQFRKKNFSDALNLISKIKYLDSLMYFYVNDLKVQIYYELNDFKNVNSIANIVKHYLHNNPSKADDFHVKTRMPLYEYIQKLIHIKQNKDYSSLENLKNKLLTTKQFSGTKTWLLEKINELQGFGEF